MNLKELHLNIEGISPSFNKDITEYYLVISNLINEIDVEAIPEEKTANINITGNKNIPMGGSKIEVIVSSEDGNTSKTYTINLSKTENEELANAKLENLAIENVNIIPEFSSDILNYIAEASSDTEKLNILAVPQNEKASVNINGNNYLQYGDNTIEIKVTAEDGVTVKIYNILVHKKTIEEENKEKEQKEAKEILNKTNQDLKKHNGKFYWWIYVVIGIIIVAIIVYVYKRFKS